MFAQSSDAGRRGRTVAALAHGACGRRARDAGSHERDPTAMAETPASTIRSSSSRRQASRHRRRVGLLPRGGRCGRRGGGGATARRGGALARARWRACFDGGTPQTPQGRALAAADRAQFHLPRAAFDALDRRRRDGPRRPRATTTFADLYRYCIRVASAVGLMCVEIFGYARIRRRGSTRSISASRCS